MTPAAKALRLQAQSCENLGSNFTTTLLRLAADNLGDDHPVGKFMHNWAEYDDFRSGAVALRLAGALNSLVLLNLDAELAEVYPPNALNADALWPAVESAMRKHHEHIIAWMDSPPQTNEIRRSCALIPGFHLIVKETRLPLVLSEIGVSAGLNLNWDRYAMEVNRQVWGPKDASVRLTPEWRGPLPPNVEVKVLNREGCDVKPLDPASADDRLRMMSYIWPDQELRIKNTESALDLAIKTKNTVHREDALTFIKRRLEPVQGVARVIYHSIMWQYLSDEDQAEGEELIAATGAKATAETPVAWLRAEADGNRGSAAITINLWPGGETRELGRMDFHGRWIEWNG